jgi:glutamate-1-semialdehyde 2,1-aminomutase
LGLMVQVNRVGSMFQLFLAQEPVYDYASAKKSDSKRFMLVHKRLLELGIFVAPSQFETCFLSSAHSSRDIDETVDAFEDSLSYAMRC